MITHRLWAELCKVDRGDRVFTRMRRRCSTGDVLDLAKSLAVVPGLGLWFGVVALLTSDQLGLLMQIGVLVPMVYVVIAASVHGGAWAVSTGAALARERNQGTFDLLAVSPRGGLQTGLLLIKSVLYCEENFTVNLRELRVLLRLTLIGLVLAVFISLWAGIAPGLTLIMALGELLLIGAIYLHYQQSVVLGGLLALVVGAGTRSVGGARVVVGALFAAMQVGTLLLLAIATVLAQGFAGAVESWLLFFGLMVGSWGLIFALYEGVIQRLYRWLLVRVNEPREAMV